MASRELCQDLSVAGKRAGLGGARSGLFWEYVRIAKALQPTWGLVENVPGLLSSHRGRDFWLVLQGLRECWPVVGYRILDSRHFGVPQRRRRVFLVGGPTEAGVAQVLALTESGGGDSAAGGEAGARVADGAPDRVAAAFKSNMSHPYAGDGNLANTLEAENHQAVLTHALTGEGHDASEDGTGRGTPLVVSPTQTPKWSKQAVLHGASPSGGGQTPLVAFDTTQITSPLNRNHPRAGDTDHPLATGAHPPAVAYTVHAQNANVKTRHAFEDDKTRTLDGMSGPDRNQGGTLIHASSIRRLTPLECELLQGFPPGWTCLCTPLESYADDPDTAALACRCPDSPRYRALGNAVTVPVIAWIGRRLRGLR